MYKTYVYYPSHSKRPCFVPIAKKVYDEGSSKNQDLTCLKSDIFIYTSKPILEKKIKNLFQIFFPK